MRKLAILKVEPMNFSLRNKADKEIVISLFQKFLNSLDFPIQIVVATDALNLDTYIADFSQRAAGVSKKTGHDYSKLLADFRSYIQSVTKQVMNRLFYLVIPEKENLEVFSSMR